MFRSPFSGEVKDLDKAIADIYELMHLADADSEEYATLLSNLERLEKLKNERRSKLPSPDTIAQVVGPIIGILVIVAYEQKHVMTSKALSFLPRAKT